jgi:acyl dehydratase
MRYLEDLVLGERFACGGFTFTRADIVAFAARFDPQPFHLDEAAAKHSYFGGLVASGVHTQAEAVSLVVRATTDIAVVAGGALERARFLVPVRPDRSYEVEAWWHSTRPSGRDHTRGVALLRGEAREAAGPVVMEFGITYILARRPA